MGSTNFWSCIIVNSYLAFSVKCAIIFSVYFWKIDSFVAWCEIDKWDVLFAKCTKNQTIIIAKSWRRCITETYTSLKVYLKDTINFRFLNSTIIRNFEFAFFWLQVILLQIQIFFILYLFFWKNVWNMKDTWLNTWSRDEKIKMILWTQEKKKKKHGDFVVHIKPRNTN